MKVTTLLKILMCRVQCIDRIRLQAHEDDVGLRCSAADDEEVRDLMMAMQRDEELWPR